MEHAKGVSDVNGVVCVTNLSPVSSELAYGLDHIELILVVVVIAAVLIHLILPL
jgi:hypothetical protein